jgi:PAS domain-containing protein
MPGQTREHGSQTSLRLRALSTLTPPGRPSNGSADAAAALEVLHQLASSPSTAADALALLHELQVHQVEIDLQAEELRATRAELEAALQRQTQLYDSAPVGYYTIGPKTELRELNLTGAELLGAERSVLLGRRLDSFLEPSSAHTLHEMLSEPDRVHRKQSGVLKLVSPERAPRAARACVSADPAGGGSLLVLAEVADT